MAGHPGWVPGRPSPLPYMSTHGMGSTRYCGRSHHPPSRGHESVLGSNKLAAAVCPVSQSEDGQGAVMHQYTQRVTLPVSVATVNSQHVAQRNTSVQKLDTCTIFAHPGVVFYHILTRDRARGFILAGADFTIKGFLILSKLTLNSIKYSFLILYFILIYFTILIDFLSCTERQRHGT
jgi:hypothetical protein